MSTRYQHDKTDKLDHTPLFYACTQNKPLVVAYLTDECNCSTSNSIIQAYLHGQSLPQQQANMPLNESLSNMFSQFLEQATVLGHVNDDSLANLHWQASKGSLSEFKEVLSVHGPDAIG